MRIPMYATSGRTAAQYLALTLSSVTWDPRQGPVTPLSWGGGEVQKAQLQPSAHLLEPSLCIHLGAPPSENYYRGEGAYTSDKLQ